MKYFMLKLFIFMLLALSVKNVLAQGISAEYTYDENGNRLTAVIIYLKASLKAEITSLDSVLNSANIQNLDSLPKDGWIKSIPDPYNEIVITAYPNPTHGMLLIKLDGINTISSDSKLQLYDSQGKKVLFIESPSIYNNLDFSALPNGIYILKICSGSIIKEFKIIKN